MSSFTDSRWRVHPIGRAATLRRAAAEAVFWGLMGLLGLFGIALLSGIVAEEVFAGTEAATTLDLVSRASLVGGLVLALSGLLALGLLGALEGPLLARALSAVMRRGAPATSVPIPLQWEAARKSSARAYKHIAIVLLAILGFFYVIVVLAAMAGMTAFQIMVAAAYPDATRTASRQLGERADLGPGAERMVDLLATGMGVAGGVGILAFAGVVVCTIILRRLEHRQLRRTLADPAAVAPPYALLSRAMAPTSLTVLKVLFAFAGAAAALGIALWFVNAVAELPDWDVYAAAGPELRAAGPLGPWIVLGSLVAMILGIALASVLDARDQNLRDELVQRWPVRPVEEDETAEESAETEEPGGQEKSLH